MLLFLSLQVSGQSVEMMDFASFEKRMKKESDTLFVYNFWATWCKPCVEELPYFDQLNETYKAQKVKVVLVSLDGPKFFESMLIPFVQKRNVGSDVILLNAPDYDSWMGKISEEWSGALPGTLLKRNSDIHLFKEQSFSYETLSEWVDSVLAISN